VRVDPWQNQAELAGGQGAAIGQKATAINQPTGRQGKQQLGPGRRGLGPSA